MPHPNIEERQQAVKIALQGAIRLSAHQKRDLASQFDCSTAAIVADIHSILMNGPLHYCGSAMRRRIRARDGNVCQYCGLTREMMIVEHIITKSLGGVAKPWNLVIACQVCNSTKRSAVWIPRNFDLITAEQPDWRALVLSMVNGAELSRPESSGAHQPGPFPSQKTATEA